MRAAGSIVEFLRRCARRARSSVPQPKMFESGGGSVVVGLPAPGAHDIYHSLLRASWKRTLGALALAFVIANLVFASLYAATGGVANARPGSLADLFFFSVETMSTVGYGEMYPATRLAHSIVVVEALCGILLVATTTGLVFAKFSRPTARLIFSRKAVIATMDGVPTLMFRVANARGNAIVAAEFHLVLIRTERNVEGQTIYRMHDLPLARTRVPSLTRTYLAMHRIDETSILHAATKESIERDEVQLAVALVGIDGTTSQTIHAGHDYLIDDILFGMRFADMLSELPDGRLRVDFSRFDEVVPG